MPRTMSRESSVKRKSGSQTSLKKKGSGDQAETKRLIQEETVEQGSVSGFLLLDIFMSSETVQESLLATVLMNNCLSKSLTILSTYCTVLPSTPTTGAALSTKAASTQLSASNSVIFTS